MIPTPPPGNPNRLRAYFAPFVLLYGAIGAFFPFFTLWLRDTGLTDSRIAIVSAMPAIATILWSQFWGYAADALFTPRRLLFVNTLAVVALFCLFPWVHGLFWICALFFLFSTFNTPLWQFLNSLLLSHDHGERRFAVIRSMGSIGFIVVNLLTGALCVRYGSPVFFLLFSGTLVLFLLSMLTVRESPPGRVPRVLPPSAASRGATSGPVPAPHEAFDPFLAPETQSAPAGKRPGFLEIQKTFLRRPAVLVFLLFVMVYQMAHQVSHAFMGLYVRDLGGSDQTVAYSYSLAAAAETLVFWVADRILARRSAVPPLILAAVFQALRWALLWMWPSLEVAVWSNLLHAITFGLYFAACGVFMNRLSPRGMKTSGQTLFAWSFFGFAALAGNLLGSVVIGAAGLRGWYAVAALVSALSAGVAALIPREPVAGVE